MRIFQFKTTPKPPSLLREASLPRRGQGGRLLSLLFSCLQSLPVPRYLLRKASQQFSKPKLDIPKLGLGNEEGFETESWQGGELKFCYVNFSIQDHPQTPSLPRRGQGGSITKLTFFLLAKPPAPRGEQLSKPKLDIPKLGLGNEEGFETESWQGGDLWQYH